MPLNNKLLLVNIEMLFIVENNEINEDQNCLIKNSVCFLML